MKFLICGGSGFIGQHVTRRLTAEGHFVRIYDRVVPTFGSGVCRDIHDLDELAFWMRETDIVFHLASNADISTSAEHPTLDFYEGTELTQNVLEAMRRTGTKRLVYFSGSGVYGDFPNMTFSEDHGPLLPISTYGASKLASEALIHAYCSMFGLHARVLRPANIVGPGQTHGVGLDFVRKLKANPDHLNVLGNGSQFKSYIHVGDVLDAVWRIVFGGDGTGKYQVYNIASPDYITVREIAELAVALTGSNATIKYSMGDRGWNGDVPSILFDCSALRGLGWEPKFGSLAAMQDALKSFL